MWDQGTFTPVGAKGGPHKTTFPSEFAMKFAPWQAYIFSEGLTCAVRERKSFWVNPVSVVYLLTFTKHANKNSKEIPHAPRSFKILVCLHCFYHNGWYSWKLNNIIHPSARSKSDFKNNFTFSCWFWNRIVKESEIEINSLFNTSTFYLLFCAAKVNLKNKRRINQSN